jgi:hypothetical protein
MVSVRDEAFHTASDHRDWFDENGYQLVIGVVAAREAPNLLARVRILDDQPKYDNRIDVDYHSN